MTESIGEHELVVLVNDMPEDGLVAGDVGVVLLRHEGSASVPPGYTIEVTTLLGETVAVVDVEDSMVRVAGANDVRHVRCGSIVA